MTPVHRRLAFLVSSVCILATACTTPVGSESPRASNASATPHASTTSPPPTALELVPAGYRLPAPVERAVAVEAGGTVYIAGGLDASGTSVSGVFAMDPTTGAIHKLGDMPQPFHDAAGALIGNSLVVFGGGTGRSSDAVQAFDLRTHRGRILGRLPTPVSDLTAATVGDNVYLVGGWDGTAFSSTIWATTDGRTFRRAGGLPVAVRYPAVAASGNVLVIAGGLLADGLDSSIAYRFDPRTGKTATLGTLATPLAHAMAFTAGPNVYVVGGEDAAGNTLAAVDVVDPVAGTVKAAKPLPRPVSDAAVAVDAAGALLIGGSRGGAVTDVVRTRPTTQTGAARNATGTEPSAAAARRPFAGLLLIADRGNNRLLVVNGRKRVVWRYPSADLPAPTLPFYFPDDAFWVHGGHAILVNEEENDVLTEIAYPSGTTLWTYGHPRVPGSLAGYVHQPDDLYPYAFHGGGLVVADARNCRILFFDATGRPTRQIGRTGDCASGLPATVGYPNASTPLPNGDLLVTELFGSIIARVTSSGAPVWQRQIPGLGVPSDPQMLPDGSILAVDYGHPGAVVRFLPDGHVVWRYDPASGPGVLDHPSLGAPLPNGLVAVNDDYGDRVVLIDPKTNTIVWQYGITGTPGTASGYLRTPDGLDLLLPGGDIPLHLDFGSRRVRPGRP
jgi:outer membrane protein assembly factor BamB